MTSTKNLWPFSFYFLHFAGVASFGPYRVLHYQSLSFTGAQIGLLAGITPLITLVSLPLVTGLADRTNQHKLIFPYIKTFSLLFGLVILFSVFFSAIMSLSTSATLSMLGDKKELYGRIRLGGTIGFGIVATAAGSLVENYGLKIAFWSAAGLFFKAFFTSQKLIHGGEESGKPADKCRASELLKNPHFLLFLRIGFSGGVSFATLNTYHYPYLKELGIGKSLMGLALTIGTISEGPILFFANRFINWFKPYLVLIFSLGMTGLCFLQLALALSPTFVLFVQLPNGFRLHD